MSRFRAFLSVVLKENTLPTPLREIVWNLWISSVSDNVDFVRTSTNSNPPEDILNSGSKFPFANRINDRVAQKTGHEDTRGDQDHLGRHFETRDELTTKWSDPSRDTAKQECCNDDTDINSRLPFSYSSWNLLAWLIFGSCARGVFYLDNHHVVSLKRFHRFENLAI